MTDNDHELDPEDQAMFDRLAERSNALVTCFLSGDDPAVRAAGIVEAHQACADGLGPYLLEFMAATLATVLRVMADQGGQDVQAVWREWCAADAAHAAGLTDGEG